MLLIHKESGMSSFAVIEKLRKKLTVKKIGHAGTLDPLAEGLLIVLVGKEETKKAQDFIGLEKEYEAVARLGVSTDSGDLEGKIIRKKKPKNISDSEIKSAIESLKGCHCWQVPAYSAIKVKGKALYKYARSGQNVELPKKKMCIYEIRIKEIIHKEEYIDIRYVASVSSGTYVRTISEQLGERLKYPATTAYIKRTRIGDFKLEDAKKLSELQI